MLPFSHALETELHVWLVRPEEVTDTLVLDGYKALLSAEEHERYRKFHFDRDRHLYLVSHALVRRVLSHYADVPPSAWQFAVNRHGKPEIVNQGLPVNLQFNLSHTHGLAACLVAQDVDCGIDVERLSAARDTHGIANRMLPAQELQQLASLDGDAYLEQFFAYWTLHEAFSKALGVGIANVDRGHAFTGQGVGAYKIQCPDHWQLSVQRPTDEHMLALAVRSSPPVMREIAVRWLQP